MTIHAIDERVARIKKALQNHGYWYPPDAIVAVLDGRSWYKNLTGETYELTVVRQRIIENAIERADNPQPIEPLNLEAKLELTAQVSTPKKRTHKPSPKKR